MLRGQNVKPHPRFLCSPVVPIPHIYSQSSSPASAPQGMGFLTVRMSGSWTGTRFGNGAGWGVRAEGERDREGTGFLAQGSWEEA